MIYTLEFYGIKGVLPSEITLRIFKDLEERDSYVKEFTRIDSVSYTIFTDIKDNEKIKFKL